MPTIDTNWQYHGLRVVRIENELVCLDVLPELGAKIYSFVYKPADRHLLWHNPHLPPTRPPFGASFDDNWSGGWDELIPNDLPRPTPEGEMLPDHGEVWSQAAACEIVSSNARRCEVRFTVYGRVLPTRFAKTIRLEAGDPFVRVAYAFSNMGPAPIDFLWNIHPALAVTPDTWLEVPAACGITDPWRETRFPGNAGFDWPFAVDHGGQPIDLRRVDPPESALADMHYLVNVEAGWYAATDRSTQTGFALVFPREVFPHVWLFRALGGWRGLYTVILEPSTGFPYDLEVARRNRTCGHLATGETLEAEILAIGYHGISRVARVEEDGSVVAG